MTKQKKVALIVHFYIKEEFSEEAPAFFAQHEKNGRGDQGNLAFFVHRHSDDPCRYSSYEVWENEGCIEAHDETVHHKKFIERLKTMQEREKEVMMLEVDRPS